jgi:hypothetical protein
MDFLTTQFFIRLGVIYILYETSELRKKMRFEVITAMTRKFGILWDVMPCCLVDVYRSFKGTYCPIFRPEE